MKKLVIIILFGISLSFSQQIILDDFEKVENWKAINSDGVILKTEICKGYKGNGVEWNFEFKSGAGYCGIRKPVNIELDENFQFSFYIQADAPINNLEFKLVDSSGENVWWLNQRNYEFPKDWKKVTIKKRNISFAWGPLVGGEINNVAYIEIFIAAGSGGHGKIMIDELSYEKLKPDNYNFSDKAAAASSSVKDFSPFKAIDQLPDSKWHSLNEPKEQWFALDLKETREFGGIIIDWDSIDYPKKYDILLSENMTFWRKVKSIDNCSGKRDYIFLPEAESRFIKLILHNGSSSNGYGIKNIEIKNIDFSNTPNKFFKNVAKDFPEGYFPKYLYDKQSFWTIVGVNSDFKEGLINEQGMIEIDKSNCSIEPFLYIKGKLLTWKNARIKQSLDQNYPPIPIVDWDVDDVTLQIKVFASGDSGHSSLFASYKIKNNSSQKKNGSLFLAIRPFQIVPPWQDLNITGGFAKIQSIKMINGDIKINQDKDISLLSKPSRIGFTNFESGEIITYIQNGILPNFTEVHDSLGFASGALEYRFNLDPSQEKYFFLEIPLYGLNPVEKKSGHIEDLQKYIEQKYKETKKFWENELNRLSIKLPPSGDKIINTLKSTIAYILINRDGAAIQPGSRTYERAWIRDGSLTSSALLKMGIQKEVKEYLDWYSKYIFENGKVPCVVDKRGPDPVPEYDSQGEYIYAILQYYLFTKDKDFLKSKYSTILNVVKYIEYLTSQRKTEKYLTKENRAFYGLVPESISHEGYSAKPMHSYWDDFFIMKGLKDAVTIAHILNDPENEKRFIQIRDDFKKNLYSSINMAIQNNKIDYIPGCVELGDFDATSTAIALYPCNELENLPQKQLSNTFNKYFDYFIKRTNPSFDWENYTPYEIRLCGTFILLNEKERSHKMLDFFFSHQRPQGWNHWAEVVWKDPNTPKMIGDMPHTWVGSDYLNSIRSMFVYEKEDKESLIIAAGVQENWIDVPEGVSIKNFPTYFGLLDYSVKSENKDVIFTLAGNIEIPKGKIIIKSPRSRALKEVIINNKQTKNFTNKEVIIDEFPAIVVLKY